MANLSNINNKFLFTDGDFLKIGNSAPINNISGTESGISITNGNCASITLDNSAAQGKTFSIYSAVNGSLNFFDVDAASGRLVIDTSGNATFAGDVQLGGTTPTLNFYKTSNADILANIKVESDTGTGGKLTIQTKRNGNTALDALVIYENQNATFEGNVGIGDATPGFPLVVSKSSSTTSNGANLSMRLTLSNPDQTNNNYALINFNDGTSQPGSGFMGMQFTDHTNNYGELVFGTRGVGGYGEKMRIDSEGNVGIGLTDPENRLQIDHPGNPTAIRIGDNTTDDCYVIFNTDGNDWSIGTDRSDSNKFKISDYSRVGTNDRLVIDTSGNVGIGNTNPSAFGKFVVQGTGNLLNLNATSGKVYQAFYENGVGRFYLNTLNGSDGLAFTDADGATERMRIDSDGAVLVGGSDSPSTSWKGTAVFGQQGTNKVIIGYLSAFSENIVGGHNSALDAWDSLSFAATDFKFRTGSGATDTSMVIDSSGDVGIGTTNPDYKLEVQGDAYINGRDFGKPINYASAQGWVTADPTSNQTGFFNGNFTPNGGATENKVYWDYNYAGQRALIWRSQNNDAGSNADGGWNKMMDVASNNMGYMSVVYVKRNTSSSSGTFYHGCYGGNTLYLTGTANTNPYFHSFGVSALPQDVWCVSIGFIQANNDSNTANNPVGGVYRLDTGAKIYTGSSTFKMGTDSQIRQQHRAYLYYSTDVNQNLSFSDPGFYALDGSQPSISDLFGAGVPTSSSSPFGQALKTYSSSAVVTVATTVNASTVANLVSGHITITASTGASIIVKTFGIYETSNWWFKDEGLPNVENPNNDIEITCSGVATNTLTFTVGDPNPVAGYGMTVSIQASPPGFFNL
jgi:hypothetical protein